MTASVINLQVEKEARALASIFSDEELRVEEIAAVERFQELKHTELRYEAGCQLTAIVRARKLLKRKREASGYGML